MNELKQIRTMAEMILEKVDALEGAKPESTPFDVGYKLFKDGGGYSDIWSAVKHDSELEGAHNGYMAAMREDGAKREMKAEPKFKVGDRVRSISGQSYGAIGTVSEVHGNLYYVNFDHGVYHLGYNHEDGLILTKCDTCDTEPKFKIGDSVVGDFDSITKFGTVTQRQGGGWYVIEWNDKTTNSVSIHDKHSDKFRLATKDDREWHSGPPPHVGWWNASQTKHNESWRWWNGSSWSRDVHQNDGSAWAGAHAMWVETAEINAIIKWTDYWPENARVPRVNPETGEVTGI